MSALSLIASLTLLQYQPHPDLSRISEIDSYLQRLSGFGYSGTTLIVKDDAILFEKGYGLADRDRGTPCRPDTLFEIGSLTKQFTATAIMKLEAEGKLHLSDKIGNILPNIPEDKKGITIENLLTHESGLARVDQSYREITRDAFIALILVRPLYFAPGTKGEYSNEGYDMLGYVIEQVSGQDFRTYLRKNLFESAGMSATGWSGSSLGQVRKDQIAKGYDWLTVKEDLEEQSGTTWLGLGSGLVTTTTGDLYKWFKALQSGAIIPKASLIRMWSTQNKLDGFTKGYGYGWFTNPNGLGVPLIRHGGDGWAFGSDFRYYPTENLLMITLCNVRHDLYPSIVKGGNRLASILWNQKIADPPSFEKDSKLNRSEIVGAYRVATGTLSVIKDHGELYVSALGQDAIDAIDPVSADEHKVRTDLNALAVKAAQGAEVGDFAALDVALGGGPHPGFEAGWKDESAAISHGQGKLKGIVANGTYRSGEGGWNTLLRFDFERGSTPYLLKWADDKTINEATVKSPTSAAMIPLQPSGVDELVGWNLKEDKGIKIRLVRKDGKISGLSIAPLEGGASVEASRL